MFFNTVLFFPVVCNSPSLFLISSSDTASFKSILFPKIKKGINESASIESSDFGCFVLVDPLVKPANAIVTYMKQCSDKWKVTYVEFGFCLPKPTFVGGIYDVNNCIDLREIILPEPAGLSVTTKVIGVKSDIVYNELFASCIYFGGTTASVWNLRGKRWAH